MNLNFLNEQKRDLAREASNMLASRGARYWSAADQREYDVIVDQIDSVVRQIDGHKREADRRAESEFTDARRISRDAPITPRQAGWDRFLRISASKWTAADETVISNTMSTTTNTQGGYTVQTNVAKEFLDLMVDAGGMRRLADRITTTTGAPLNMPTTDGRAEIGEWITQNTAATSADMSFSTAPLTTYKFGSKIITVPRELLKDSQIDVVSLVQKRMRDRIARIQNIKFSTGAGDSSNEPFGLTTTATVGTTGATGQVLTITYDNLVSLSESLDHAYLQEPGISWSCCQTTRGLIRKLRDTSGRPIYLPGYGSLQEDVPDSLLGYPLIVNNDMPPPGANVTSLSFGLHSRYVIRDVLDSFELFRFEDSAYMSRNQVGFLAWTRAGGNLLDTAAVKLYKHSAS
jgi:HK97 family phage major capsid protein